jgi:pseudaminic acid biosynthesis-associated methylase
MLDATNCTKRDASNVTHKRAEGLPSQTAALSKQVREWKGAFGRKYTNRNDLSLKELDGVYVNNYGVTRRELNERFLRDVPKDARILEVGCNVGNQLRLLQGMGYHNLFGIEIQAYAVKLARKRTAGIRLVNSSGLEIPFNDSFFDVVFTSGVLIHIAPENLRTALTEIHRCTRDYIWGLEYFAPEVTEVVYRGYKDLMWKADYAHLYVEAFPDLEIAKEERLKYLQNENTDSMFLLRKRYERTP